MNSGAMADPGEYSLQFMERSGVDIDLDIVPLDGRLYVSIEDLDAVLQRCFEVVKKDVVRHDTLLAVADPRSDRASVLVDESLEMMGLGNGLLTVKFVLSQVGESIAVDKKK
jgi:hypothetical protein